MRYFNGLEVDTSHAVISGTLSFKKSLDHMRHGRMKVPQSRNSKKKNSFQERKELLSEQLARETQERQQRLDEAGKLRGHLVEVKLR